jgi:hypothetical protein
VLALVLPSSVVLQRGSSWATWFGQCIIMYSIWIWSLLAALAAPYILKAFFERFLYALYHRTIADNKLCIYNHYICMLLDKGKYYSERRRETLSSRHLGRAYPLSPRLATVISVPKPSIIFFCWTKILMAAKDKFTRIIYSEEFLCASR